jgi:transposase InsO family protein
MRLPGSEKLEIIRLVEQSHLPARRTLEILGIRPSTFYRWYDRYRAGGPEALEDKPSRPDRVWNRIPDAVRKRILAMALEVPELSPRELATRFTDAEGYFVSESSIYRLLKAHDLITSPAFVVIKAADEFKDKTTAPNQLWQTDFTYLKVIGWGWFYLSTILDDFSRYIIAWKLCTTMRADDVTDTLQMALTASGCSSARVVHKPRLLSDNGSSYVSGDLAKWLEETGMHHVRGAPCHPQTQGKIEVDPVSWRPECLRFGSPRCARSAHTMRRSSGGRWSSWYAPAGRLRSWRMSSSLRLRRSESGSPKPTAMRVGGQTA